MKQNFLSIYFPRKTGQNKTVCLAFSPTEEGLFSLLKQCSSEEIRNLLGVVNFEDIEESAKNDDRSVNQYIKIRLKSRLSEIDKKEVSFIKSKTVPFQRWFPYLEGYGVEFVKYIFSKYGKKDFKTIYEPFAGTGTTIFGASELGLNSYYSEVNPLLAFIVKVKKEILSLPIKKRVELSEKIGEIRESLSEQSIKKWKKYKKLEKSYISAFEDSVYFSPSNFDLILRIKSYEISLSETNELIGDLFRVGIITSLVQSSLLKRSGDLRFKTTSELRNSEMNLLVHLKNKLSDIQTDLLDSDFCMKGKHDYIVANAKKVGQTEITEPIDMVITSPPYLNGTNYFRNTKLELWYLEIIQSQGDLRKYRDEALTSGINDVICTNNSDDILKFSPTLEDNYWDLVRMKYDKRIPIMAKQYFEQNLELYLGLSKKLKKGSRIAIDIGDSIFSGVHIRVDKIYEELLGVIGYKFINKELLRKRRSRGGQILSQFLLVFEYVGSNEGIIPQDNGDVKWKKDWNKFKTIIPYQSGEFSKRNWGHPNHSICSYQGKLKPAIAYHLIKTFVPKDGTILDIFSGVGTIPFEAALNGIKAYGFDLSELACIVSEAKISKINQEDLRESMSLLGSFIQNEKALPTSRTLADSIKGFGFNKKLADYYEESTLIEILLARKYFKQRKPLKKEDKFILACLLHILHGNRPYALSRRSHPIIPYAPTGDFEYKSLMEKLGEKVWKTYEQSNIQSLVEGEIFHIDSTSSWPEKISKIDAIITSPPFFDSTKFHLANWIRLWFAGWEQDDFKINPKKFVDERQKMDFSVYDKIFSQAHERLRDSGVFVLHLGKSKKCDMAKRLIEQSQKWFEVADLFSEDVTHCESHGIKDKGSVTEHQFLILKKRPSL